MHSSSIAEPNRPLEVDELVLVVVHVHDPPFKVCLISQLKDCICPVFRHLAMAGPSVL
jgi:hypothetical protein